MSNRSFGSGRGNQILDFLSEDILKNEDIFILFENEEELGDILNTMDFTLKKIMNKNY